MFVDNCEAEIDALFDKFIIKYPTIKCGAGNHIERFCTSQACKTDSRCCRDDKCEFCSLRHQNCILFAQTKGIAKKVSEKILSDKMIVQSILKMEKDLINELIKSRKSIINRLSLWRYQENCQAINQIYFQQNVQGLNGKIIRNLLSELSDKAQQMQFKRLDKFQSNRKNIIRDMIADRNNLIDHLFREKIHTSSILKEDAKCKQKMAFLLKQLEYPTELKLLFRASEHGFEAEKFWTFCSDISNTLTIVQTGFNKTIAAFTPLKWQKDMYQNTCVADHFRETFLLQLDLKEKMTIMQGHEEFAICLNKKYGPGFGKNGNDLWIGNNCNQDGSNSGSKFPSDYNSENKYQQSQESQLAFTGVQDGFRFTVVEYEVFQVIR